MKTANSDNRRSNKDLKLNLLLEVTKAINNNLSTEGLLKIFQDFLRNQLSIGKLIVFAKEDNGWGCALKYGVGSEYDEIDVPKYLHPIREITTIQYTAQLLSASFEIVVPVLNKENPLAYILLGDLEEEQLMVSPAIKHLPFIQTLANVIFVAIENKLLVEENMKQVALNRELELASEMQTMLFPSRLPNDAVLEMDAKYLPHRQVGGDYYDYIPLNDHEFVFCMGDVSGKGIAAALLMSNFQANLRAFLLIHKNLKDLIRELNTRVIDSTKGEKFITFFIGKYNSHTKTLHYINAGHNPPLYRHHSNSKVETLTLGCTGLGMIDELLVISEGVIAVQPGDQLICYTDGVVELENAAGIEFGEDRMVDILEKGAERPMRDMNNQIITDLNLHKGTGHYHDDITLIACRFK